LLPLLWNEKKKWGITFLSNLRILQWAGHTVRIDNTGVPKKFGNGKFHGKGSVGRPWLRREDKNQYELLVTAEYKMMEEVS
jgi:hypothetical protein